MKCEICKKEFKNIKSIANHIKIHNLSSNEYYDIYLIPSLPNSKPYGNNTDITKVFNFEKTDDALDSSRYVLLWERLQVVGFIEAFKAYREQKIIKSVVTGHKYSSLYGIGVTIINATNEEIDSTWIILKGSETSEL
jgi:hypothetical protein